jgi:hypothetical protein
MWAAEPPTALRKDPVSGPNCSLRTASKRAMFLNEWPGCGVYTVKGQN